MTGGTRPSQPTRQGSPQASRRSTRRQPRGPLRGPQQAGCTVPSPTRGRAATRPASHGHARRCTSTHNRGTATGTDVAHSFNVDAHGCPHGESHTRGHTHTYSFTCRHGRTPQEHTPTHELRTRRATHAHTHTHTLTHSCAPGQPASQPGKTIACSEGTQSPATCARPSTRTRPHPARHVLTPAWAQPHPRLHTQNQR